MSTPLPPAAPIAALLARHPRFHPGESLLTANLPLPEALSMRGQVDTLGMPRWGVELVSAEPPQPAGIQFADARDKSPPKAWQLRRTEFDEILLRNAEAAGANVLDASF